MILNDIYFAFLGGKKKQNIHGAKWWNFGFLFSEGSIVDISIFKTIFPFHKSYSFRKKYKYIPSLILFDLSLKFE